MEIKRNYGGLLSVTALAVITMLTPLVEPITLANRNQVQTGMTDGLYYIISWIFIPMICYIAGSTVREKQSQGKSLGQMAVALLAGYVFMHFVLATLETIMIGSHNRVYFLSPIGNLWIILSIIIWLIVSRILKSTSTMKILLAAILLSCIISCLPYLYGLPILAYVILLFPFYYLGYYDVKIGKVFETSLRNKIIMCVILVFLCFIMLIGKRQIAVYIAPMLTGTSLISYQECGFHVLTGMVLRVLWYIGGFFFIRLSMYLLPEKETFLSKLGKHSLVIFTLSAAVFFYLIQCKIGDYNNIVYNFNYYGVVVVGTLITLFFALLSYTGIYHKWNDMMNLMINKIKRSDLLKKVELPLILQGNVRIRLIVAVVFCFIFTFIIFSSNELFIANDKYLALLYRDVWPVMLFAGIIMMLILGTILYFLKDKQLFSALTLLFGVLLCGYVQGNFWNGGLQALDGEKINWLQQWQSMTINILSWISIISALFWVSRKYKIIWRYISEYFSYLLIAMQCVALVTLVATADWADKNHSYFKTDKEFVLSNQSNVIVFVLDFYDNNLFENIMDIDKSFLEPLNGFTYFSNMISKFSRTFPAIDYLLSGQEYLFDIPIAEYQKKAYTDNEFWQSVSGLGYNGRIFAVKEFSVGNVEYLKGYIDNAGNASQNVPKGAVFTNMLKLVGYKHMPEFLKHYFRFYTDDINNQLKNGYCLDDKLFFEQLKETKLTLNNEKPNFIFYHLNGAHAPYHLDSKGNFLKTETTQLEHGMGALSIVYEYIQQMKDLGIYDDSMIIITADHGNVYIDGSNKLDTAFNPILLVKPSGSNIESELKISYAPVMHSDLFPTILSEMGDTTNEKKTVFSISEHDKRDRFLYRTITAPNSKEGDDRIEVWKIKDDANDFNNWYLQEVIKTKYSYY